MSDGIIVENTLLDKMHPSVRLPYRDAVDAYQQAYAENRVSWGVMALRIADLERRFTNPVLTVRDAIALREAAIAEMTMLKEASRVSTSD